MRILAIDPGYDRLGIAILEKNNSKEALVYSECFETERNESHPKRLALVADKISNLIKKYKPDTLAIETLFFTKNQKTALKVAEVRGIILALAASAGLEIFECGPMQVKSAVTGSGKSDKRQVETMVRKLIAVPANVNKDDELDAVAIGLTCFAMINLARKSFKM